MMLAAATAVGNRGTAHRSDEFDHDGNPQQ